MTEQQIRNKVADIITSWVGATRGSTIHKDILKIYNSYKPLPRGYKLTESDAWCAATVSAAWIKADVAKICPIECSCSKMIEIAKSMNIWVEDDKYVPKIGDAIIYDWDDSSNYANTDNKNVPDHVGIVIAVYDNSFIVAEGNMKVDGIRKVGKRTMKVNGKYIRGFVTPNYASLATKKSIDEIAHEVIRGLWGNGLVRKTRLRLAGYNPDEVQKRVNEILKGQDSYVVYTVQYGDTLSKIAKKYNTTYQKIAKDNGIKDPNKIYVGQKLKIYQ